MWGPQQFQIFSDLAVDHQLCWQAGARGVDRAESSREAMKWNFWKRHCKWFWFQMFDTIRMLIIWNARLQYDCNMCWPPKRFTKSKIRLSFFLVEFYCFHCFCYMYWFPKMWSELDRFSSASTRSWTRSRTRNAGRFWALCHVFSAGYGWERFGYLPFLMISKNRSKE